MKFWSTTISPFVLMVGFLFCLDLYGDDQESLQVYGNGVVIDRVGVGTALERAGVAAGDVIVSWFDESMSEKQAVAIDSVLDWKLVELSQAPRGKLFLYGLRQGEGMVFEVQRGLWESDVLPYHPDGDYSTKLDVLKEIIEAGTENDPPAHWRRILSELSSYPDDSSRAWAFLRLCKSFAAMSSWDAVFQFYAEMTKDFECRKKLVVSYRFGEICQRSGQLDCAERSYEDALTCSSEISAGPHSAYIHNGLGAVAFWRGELDEAEGFYGSALSVGMAEASGSVVVATSLNRLGINAYKRGDFDGAMEKYQQALAILEDQAPGTLPVSVTLNNLGIVCRHLGRLDQAVEYYKRALGIDRKISPGGLGVASTLSNLGVIEWMRDDLDAALLYYEQALKIRRLEAPLGIEIPGNLSNIGNIYVRKGDWGRAEAYYREALVMVSERSPGSFEEAEVLNNLGSIFGHRGEVDRALWYQNRALRIYRAKSPGNIRVKTVLNNISALHYMIGDIQGAVEYAKESVEVDSPESLASVYSLSRYGFLVGEAGDSEEAERLLNKAIDIAQIQAPKSLLLAEVLSSLGVVKFEGGHLGEAKRAFKEALEIREGVGVRSVYYSGALQNMGDVLRAEGDLREAEAYYAKSIDVLEEQIDRLGGAQELKGRFRARESSVYRRAISLSFEVGNQERAFDILERSRARSFLALLAERNLDIPGGVSGEFAGDVVAIKSRYREIQDELIGLSLERDQEDILALKTEMSNLLSDYEDLRDLIKKKAPGASSLTYPEPLGLRDVQRSLDSDTVLLSYSVDEEEVYLFCVTDEVFSSWKIDVSRARLSEMIEGFLVAIRESVAESSLRAFRVEQVDKLAAEIYDLLVSPAEHIIERQERVLLVPDGPLHKLPFSALRNFSGDNEGRYLVEWRPFHIALSATHYAELKKERRLSTIFRHVPKVVAFGDPMYRHPLDEDFGGAGELLAAKDFLGMDLGLRGAAYPAVALYSKGYEWDPLPYSRLEVGGISEVYGSSARVYYGVDASEENVKNVGPDVDVLHLAVHGYVDEAIPLNSSIVLSNPESAQEDGLLQAWEIYESMRIDADLVFLSACESGRGKFLWGEGLIGLTRAFQYAGARTVAATLWNVNDQVTSILVRRFYRHLHGGKAKDEALRAAQAELVSGPVEVRNSEGEVMLIHAGNPYYWAAFQIFGDWR